VSGQIHALVAIFPQKNLAIHQLGQWVSLRTGQEFLGEKE
jgi:hypothetical protein